MPALNRYPAWYFELLQALPLDGTPVVLPLTSNEEAIRERLLYYNFLKWCRRNPHECVQLGQRYNTVVLSVKGNALIMQLRASAASQSAHNAAASVLALLNRPGQAPRQPAPAAPEPGINMPMPYFKQPLGVTPPTPLTAPTIGHVLPLDAIVGDPNFAAPPNPDFNAFAAHQEPPPGFIEKMVAQAQQESIEAMKANSPKDFSDPETWRTMGLKPNGEPK